MDEGRELVFASTLRPLHEGFLEEGVSEGCYGRGRPEWGKKRSPYPLAAVRILCPRAPAADATTQTYAQEPCLEGMCPEHATFPKRNPSLFLPQGKSQKVLLFSFPGLVIVPRTEMLEAGASESSTFSELAVGCVVAMCWQRGAGLFLPQTRGS